MNIKITEGDVTLRRPFAGERNDALIGAETETGFSKTKMMVDLLPSVIVSHPFSKTIPLKESLRKITPEDYDKLITGLAMMLKPQEDLIKNLDKPSDSSTTQAENTGK